jgi:protein ImuB
MFACLYSLSTPPADLVKVAQDFTPRYEIMGSLVFLDLSGLSRLFGTAREIGEQLRMAMAGAPVRIAIAPSQTASALLALGRAGLSVVSFDEQPAALAPLPVSLLGELEKLRAPTADGGGSTMVDRPLTVDSRRQRGTVPPHVAAMEDVLPYFQSCLDRASEAARTSAFARAGSHASSASHMGCGSGWQHPRDAHAARLTKMAKRASMSPAKAAPALKDVQALLDVLRRWGIKTLGALTALPAGDVYERLGARGVAWQRLARGEDQGPLVPCVPEDPFEGSLELEWPIEGLEPLSFVLARLFEPLAERLERADRGAAILHTHLRLTTRDVHARTVQLPAPMRDPKTLRTLVLLDLESNPPSAAIDRVRVLVEPTPAKVLQWTLYDRAQPSPEQVSTLIARLTALMGEGHVGSPKLVDSWKPGAFEIAAFNAAATPMALTNRIEPSAPTEPVAPGTALRRFRLPIPARVRMEDGRPVRIIVDRRGVSGGAVIQAAGPWRTSGEWWNDGQVGQVGHVKTSLQQAAPPAQCHQPSTAWDRDEWDIALHGGPTYRIFVERSVGQWFIDGIVD